MLSKFRHHGMSCCEVRTANKFFDKQIFFKLSRKLYVRESVLEDA